ncbi:16S rRNA (cytosine(1402)-N(4))-methyltransferase RsmH [Candidatus Babeliales bacterium]|nr:16S rRNA (cytosine(1402)-N(4))-methyltransferase RsmH [Candidatus Babeliales bacterium]
MNEIYHKSVLVKEVIENLNIKENKTYLDVTFGGGGHTRAILEQNPTCKVIAVDWDKMAVKINGPKLKEEYGDRVKILWGNFALIDRLLKKEEIEYVDGILADFGTSQYQIKKKEGFSFNVDSPLDMRMSQSHQYIKASDVLNRFTQKELSDIFFNYGQEYKSRKIAQAIIEYRKKRKFVTSRQLAELIENITPGFRRLRIHPATKVFQALRIFINKELENIEIFLSKSINFLNKNGRIACISFHSLEDRIVKSFFKQNEDKLKIITKKPITANPQEIGQNLSSRSAKLRVAEKK